jgi:hypothetical protein
MASPSSIMASISAVVGRHWSGASIRLDVVPKMETVPAGIRMSASAGFAQPVEHPFAQPHLADNQAALGVDHVNPGAGQRRHLTGPRPGGIDNLIGINMDFVAVTAIHQPHRLNMAVALDKPHDLVMQQQRGPQCPGLGQVIQGKFERVDGSVFHRKSGNRVR